MQQSLQFPVWARDAGVRLREVPRLARWGERYLERWKKLILLKTMNLKWTLA